MLGRLFALPPPPSPSFLPVYLSTPLRPKLIVSIFFLLTLSNFAFPFPHVSSLSLVKVSHFFLILRRLLIFFYWTLIAILDCYRLLIPFVFAVSECQSLDVLPTWISTHDSFFPFSGYHATNFSRYILTGFSFHFSYEASVCDVYLNVMILTEWHVSITFLSSGYNTTDFSFFHSSLVLIIAFYPKSFFLYVHNNTLQPLTCVLSNSPCTEIQDLTRFLSHYSLLLPPQCSILLLFFLHNDITILHPSACTVSSR